jgi:hypothetical protein
MWGWILGGSREWKPGQFKNRAWRLYELNPATIPRHKTSNISLQQKLV